jgi:hypothetical protein
MLIFSNPLCPLKKVFRNFKGYICTHGYIIAEDTATTINF